MKTQLRAAQPKEPHKNSKTFCGDPVSPEMVGSLAGGTIGVPAESIFGGANEGETYRKGVNNIFCYLVAQNPEGKKGVQHSPTGREVYSPSLANKFCEKIYIK